MTLCSHADTEIVGGARTCKTCGQRVTRLSDLVAGPGFAPMEWQATAPDQLFARGVPVGGSEDLERIIAIPRREPLDLESPRAQTLIELMTQRYRLPHDPDVELVARDAELSGQWERARELRGCDCAAIDPAIKENKRTCITRMLPLQAWMTYELGVADGLVAQAFVGGGKTLFCVLAAMALEGCRTALLLLPPANLKQFILDYDVIAQHWRVPSIEVHGHGLYPDGTQASRTIPGRPTLHVLAYSRLSRPESSDWIDRSLAPDAIICDEADALSALASARTARVLRYAASHPRTRFAFCTGTATDGKLAHMMHLFALALRYSSPLPLDPAVGDDWGRAVDAQESPAPPGELLRLCQPGEHVREGVRRRMAETLGVIFTTGAQTVMTPAAEGKEREVVEIVVREREAPTIPEIVKVALDMVRNFKRPDTLVGSEFDEELVDALSQAKCATEVACGMFYRWKFPPIAGVPQKESTIREWYKARKDWNSELRYKLFRREEHLDSPHLCEVAAQRYYGQRERRNDRPEWRSEHWLAWHAIKDKVKYEPDARRLHPFLVEDAAQWARENTGIVWYGMVEFGQWLAEITGLPLHTGGAKADKLIRDERGDRSIIASLKSHGRGRNGLQYWFSRGLLTTLPSSPKMLEQLFGRTHRQGQTVTEVLFEYYAHTPEIRRGLRSAIRKSTMVQQTTGAIHKLRIGFQGPGFDFDDEDDE